MNSELKKEYEKIRDHLQNEYFVLDKYLLEGKYPEDHQQMITKKAVLSAILKQLDKTINPPKMHIASGVVKRQTEELY